MVHGDTLHDQGFRGKGKLIAILDQGFTDADTHRGFDSMRQQGRLLETYNFVLDTSFVYGFDVHGFECLSAMAGVIPGSFIGTAPDAQYALYLTEDGNFTDALYELDNLVAGMERADSIGADIISASLGYNTFTSPYFKSFAKGELDGTRTLVARAANMATAKGIFYATSAGNEGNNSWNFLVSPADADSVLTIGAVGSSRQPAGFSSPGPNAAGRVKPDVCLQGDPAAVLITGNGVGYSSGTSFAAPQAAGYAACLMQAYPMLPPAIIRESFAHISHLYANPTPKLGYGIPDFRLAQAYLQRFVPDTTSSSCRVSPNPFTTTITIALPRVSAVAEVSMSDMLGRLIGFRQERSGAVLFVTPAAVLPRGIYIMRIVVDGQPTIQKVLHL
jgi:subtilisin family serine protease